MDKRESATTRKSATNALARSFLWLLAGALLLAGCTAAHYRRSADKEVYRIIEQAETQVFGHTNLFTIETPYSARKPDDILPAELIEDRARTNQLLLTIDEALDLAVARSRTYQAQKEKLYLTALTLTGRRYAFSPQFFANGSGTLGRESDGDVFGSLGGKVGLTQLLKTGGSLGVELANDVLRYYTGSPRRKAISLFKANLVQPLLRGFGRNNPEVENLTQAERDVIYAVRNYSFFQDEFAVGIVNDYFDLLAQKDTIRNRYTNYLGRVQSTKRLEARAVDRESLADVDQARQAELTAKNNYVNAVALYQTQLDEFKIQLGLPVSEKVALDDRALGEVEQNGLVPVPLAPETAYRFATRQQLVFLNAVDQFEDAKRKIHVAANQLRAELNLVGGAELDYDGPADYTKFDPGEVAASVGLELNLPLDRLLKRNEYRATLVNFEARLREFTLALDTLKQDIDNGLRTLEQRRQNYEIQKNALTLANRRVESTTLLLEAGRAEVRDLVDAQDAQIAAQNAVVAALVDYQQARLQLLLDIGALNADLPGFWLKDHLAAFSGPAPAQSLSQPGNQAVFPPDQYFNN